MKSGNTVVEKRMSFLLLQKAPCLLNQLNSTENHNKST